MTPTRIGMLIGLLWLTLIHPVALAQTLGACQNDVNGSLRLVANEAECREHETFVSWSVTGPQGPKGEQGPPGPSAVTALTTLKTLDPDFYFSEPGDLNYYERLTLGTFTKVSDASRVRISWQAAAAIRNGGSGACTFQLRVDGLKDTGSASTSYEPGEGGDAALESVRNFVCGA